MWGNLPNGRSAVAPVRAGRHERDVVAHAHVGQDEPQVRPGVPKKCKYFNQSNCTLNGTNVLGHEKHLRAGLVLGDHHVGVARNHRELHRLA